MICHGKTGCQNKSEMRNQETTPRYGSWMRAASPTRKPKRSFGRFSTRRGPVNVDQKERSGWNTRLSDDRRRVKTQSADIGEDDAEVAGGAGAFNGRDSKHRYDGGNKGVNEGGVGDSCPNKKKLFEGGGDRGTSGETVTTSLNVGDSPLIFKASDGTESSHKSHKSPAGVDCRGEVSWGSGGRVSRPCFMGPLFSDLEKQLKVPNVGNGSKMVDGPNTTDLRGVTWKRVACGEIEQQEELHHTVKEGIGKKRELSGEATQLGPARKGQNLSLNANKTSGSGMAEAAVQPCRPQ